MTRLLSLLCLLILALPGGVQAQPRLPALFAVVDVAADDRLNIRAAPTSGAQILGSFGPTEDGIEVIRLTDDTRWGQVNLRDGAGWVYMRYLEEMPVSAGPLPPIRACFGTEPFWSLTRESPDSYAYSTPDRAPLPLLTDFEAPAPGGDTFALSASAPSVQVTGVVRREICSDGMSDRAYGLSVALVLWQLGEDGESYALHTGCCRLQAVD